MKEIKSAKKLVEVKRLLKEHPNITFFGRNALPNPNITFVILKNGKWAYLKGKAGKVISNIPDKTVSVNFLSHLDITRALEVPDEDIAVYGRLFMPYFPEFSNWILSVRTDSHGWKSDAVDPSLFHLIENFIKESGLKIGKKVYFDNGLSGASLDSAKGKEDQFLVSPYNLSSMNISSTDSMRSRMLGAAGIHERIMPPTGTTTGYPNLPLYRFIGGTVLRKPYGMH